MFSKFIMLSVVLLTLGLERNVRYLQGKMAITTQQVTTTFFGLSFICVGFDLRHKPELHWFSWTLYVISVLLIYLVAYAAYQSAKGFQRDPIKLKEERTAAMMYYPGFCLMIIMIATVIDAAILYVFY